MRKRIFQRFSRAAVTLSISFFLFGGFVVSDAFADGNETLGPPSITIASGTGVVVGGTGLFSQPGWIQVSVPAGVTIKQVLLYWEGRGPSPDSQVSVNDVTVTGMQIGTSANAYSNPSTAYRADITAVSKSMGWVNPGGISSLKISDMAYAGGRNDGAGIAVIYDDGSQSNVGIRDGSDFAYLLSPGEARVTVPQTFRFTAADFNRNAKLSLLFGDGEPGRPEYLEVEIGGVTSRYCNQLTSNAGPQWDVVELEDVLIPAGSSSLTIQAFSGQNVACPNEGGTADSLVWVFASLSMLGRQEGCTPGYWKQKHHFDSWPAEYQPNMQFSAVFDDAFRGKTLLDVLKLGGGGLNALGRHTVAALLNAASGVNYGLSPEQVIREFNAVYPSSNKKRYEQLKDFFESLNQSGCPLN